MPPRALGEIAADHHQIAAGALQAGQQRLGHGRVVAAEMQVGDLRDGPHAG